MNGAGGINQTTLGLHCKYMKLKDNKKMVVREMHKKSNLWQLIDNVSLCSLNFCPF